MTQNHTDNQAGTKDSWGSTSQNCEYHHLKRQASPLQRFKGLPLFTPITSLPHLGWAAPSPSVSMYVGGQEFVVVARTMPAPYRHHCGEFMHFISKQAPHVALLLNRAVLNAKDHTFVEINLHTQFLSNLMSIIS